MKMHFNNLLGHGNTSSQIKKVFTEEQIDTFLSDQLSYYDLVLNSMNIDKNILYEVADEGSKVDILTYDNKMFSSINKLVAHIKDETNLENAAYMSHLVSGVKLSRTQLIKVKQSITELTEKLSSSRHDDIRQMVNSLVTEMQALVRSDNELSKKLDLYLSKFEMSLETMLKINQLVENYQKKVVYLEETVQNAKNVTNELKKSSDVFRNELTLIKDEYSELLEKYRKLVDKEKSVNVENELAYITTRVSSLREKVLKRDSDVSKLTSSIKIVNIHHSKLPNPIPKLISTNQKSNIPKRSYDQTMSDDPLEKVLYETERLKKFLNKHT